MRKWIQTIYKKNMDITLEKLEGKFYIAYDYNAYEVNEVVARISY